MPFLVDTNVISEVMRADCDANVASWFKRNQEEVVFSSVTIEELWHGVERLPEGKRKALLCEVVEGVVTQFATCMLPFDTREALVCGSLQAQAVGAGHNASIEDLMIAATARVAGAPVVTRNVKDFEPLGVEVINPFMPAATEC